jgi:hypothetical protein
MNKRKNIVLALILVLPSLLYAENPNPSDYPVAVHVLSSRLVISHDGATQDLIATIDGKHVELEGTPIQQYLLRTGDYKAKVAKDEHSRSYEYEKIYEILFPDGKTRKFLVVGEDE